MNLESICSESINKEIAYLFGVYLTDGSMSTSISSFNGGKKKYKSRNFSLKTIDKEFVELTLKYLKKILPFCKANVYEQLPRTRYWTDGRVSKCQKQYCLNVGFTKYAEFFEEQTGKKHHIPFIIWEAPLSIKKWFIAGVLDGDGWASMHKRTNGSIQYRIGIGGIEEGWIYEFEKLLHTLGIGTCKKELLKEGRNLPFVRFVIKINDFKEKGMFFTIKRKQDRLISYRSSKDVFQKNTVNERQETRRCTS